MDKGFPDQPAHSASATNDVARRRFEPQVRLSGLIGMTALFDSISKGERA